MNRSLYLWINLFLFFSALASCVSPEAKFRQRTIAGNEAHPVMPSQVQLLPGPFLTARELDMQLLLWLEPDRLLHRFRSNAGLEPLGALYGGWESEGLPGHSLGHYLSACSMMYAATSDMRFKKRVDYIVDQLYTCQKARGTGYLGAIPGEDQAFDELAAGEIRVTKSELNGIRMPWYTFHKLLSGLTDAYVYGDNRKARFIAVRMGDWAVKKLDNLSEESFQKMLVCEHGGMNEALANLYALTGKKRFWFLSFRFNQKSVLNPLLEARDALNGQNANAQIPLILGCARQYEITGSEQEKHLSLFFWERVVRHHSYVIGGNSQYEHFGPPDSLSQRLSNYTAESCNSYNMLKLTRHLFTWEPRVEYGDYMERALYNHILSAQHPETGMFCYYAPLASGSQKSYSTRDSSFWCCFGTGMESAARFTDNIWFESSSGLYLNLFIPSELDWGNGRMKIRVETAYPENGKVRLVFSGKKMRKPLMIRYPSWAGKGLLIKINGEELQYKGEPGSFITIDRTWREGTVVDLEIPMPVYTESMPDNPYRLAFFYGPVVLCGELVSEPHDVSREIPLLVGSLSSVKSALEPVTGTPLTFRLPSVTTPGGLLMLPFYRMHDGRYMVYFDLISPREFARMRSVPAVSMQ